MNKFSKIVLNQSRLFIIIIFIVVLEGAVRKWVDPSLGGGLVLVRDILAMIIIYRSLESGLYLNVTPLMEIMLIFAGLTIFWGLLQIIFVENPPELFIIGLRYWLLYPACAISIAASVDENGINNIGKVLLFLLIIMTPLAVAQHLLPPGHFINYQIDTEESQIFRVSADVVRTSGTFSFTTGFALFLATVTPLALTNSIGGKKVFQKEYLKNISLVALVVSVIVSGSRTAIINVSALAVVNSVLSIALSKNQKNLVSNIIGIFLTVIFAAVAAIYFGDAIYAIQDRFATANETEDIVDRVISTFFGEADVRQFFNFIGMGLGSGTNVASYYLTGERAFLLAETEPARIIMEGGVLGVLNIALKIIFIGWASLQVLFLVKKSGEAASILYLTSCAVGLITWQMTGQLSVNGLGGILLMIFIIDIRR